MGIGIEMEIETVIVVGAMGMVIVVKEMGVGMEMAKEMGIVVEMIW